MALIHNLWRDFGIPHHVPVSRSDTALSKGGVMSSRKWFVGGLCVALCMIVGWGTGFAGKESVGSVPLETVVDYIHSVLEADRTFYTVHVVERMQRRGVIESSEQWRSASALPHVPSSNVRRAAETASATSSPFARGTDASTAPVAGSIVSNRSPERASTHVPSMYILSCSAMPRR